jgi:hypothetical protein
MIDESLSSSSVFSGPAAMAHLVVHTSMFDSRVCESKPLLLRDRPPEVPSEAMAELSTVNKDITYAVAT